MKKKFPKKMLWNNELIEKFWNGQEQTRMKELNFSLLAGSYFLELIQGELYKNKKYLDFGSGSGELVLSLITKGYKIGAYDTSIERTKSLEKQISVENKELFLGSISDDDGKLFDTIFMNEVIEHIIPDQLDDTINLIKSRLNPGGTLIITTPNNEDIDLGICYCPLCNHTFHRWQHLLSFSKKSLDDLMKKNGIFKKNIHLVDFSMNRIIIEENKKLKKQIEQLKNPNMKIKEIKNRNTKTKDMCIGAETHILYIGQLSVS